MHTFHVPWRGLARGAGAFLLFDLITGLAAFSLISLGGLWYFAFTWIRMAGEYAPLGITLGSPWQLELAWLGLLVALPLMLLTGYLAHAAYGVPRMIWARGRTGAPRGPSPMLPSLAFLGGFPGSVERRHR